MTFRLLKRTCELGVIIYKLMISRKGLGFRVYKFRVQGLGFWV